MLQFQLLHSPALFQLHSNLRPHSPFFPPPSLQLQLVTAKASNFTQLFPDGTTADYKLSKVYIERNVTELIAHDNFKIFILQRHLKAFKGIMKPTYSSGPKVFTQDKERWWIKGSLSHCKPEL